MSSKYYPKNVVFCRVCEVSYSKSESHVACYKNYCGICCEIFDSVQLQIEHSMKLHPLEYCTNCCESITTDIKKHKNRCKHNT